jgi:hypothetical protein
MTDILALLKPIQNSVSKTTLQQKAGRPKGSRNKNKTEVALNPELQFIQKMLQSLLNINLCG